MRTADPRPVFVVGSFVMACCWFTPRLPRAGEHVHADRFLMEPGGKGLNLAVALARLGTPVHLLLGVGDDGAARQALALLDHEAIGREHVHAFDGPSGHGVGLIDPFGENAIAIHPGANHRLMPEHAQAAHRAIASSALVLGQFEVGDEVLIGAFDVARQAGVPTVLNPSPWRPLDAALLSLTDTLILNEHEAGELLGQDGPLRPQEARHLDALRSWQVAHPTTQLLITLGEGGCLSWLEGQADPELHRAFKVIARDTTGCGDAFAAAWCDARARGKTPKQAIDQAQAAGAWLARQAGVLAALPTRDELDDWLRALGRQPE